MKRRAARHTVTLQLLLALSLPSAAVAAGEIREVFVDLQSGRLAVLGSGFPPIGVLEVSLGEQGPLPVDAGASDAGILLAELPPGLEPGSYRLEVCDLRRTDKKKALGKKAPRKKARRASPCVGFDLSVGAQSALAAPVVRDASGAVVGLLGDNQLAIRRVSGRRVGLRVAETGFVQGGTLSFESSDCTGTLVARPQGSGLFDPIPAIIWSDTAYYPDPEAPVRTGIVRSSIQFRPESECRPNSFFTPPDRCCTPIPFVPPPSEFTDVLTLDLGDFVPPFGVEGP